MPKNYLIKPSVQHFNPPVKGYAKIDGNSQITTVRVVSITKYATDIILPNGIGKTIWSSNETEWVKPFDDFKVKGYFINNGKIHIAHSIKSLKKLVKETGQNIEISIGVVVDFVHNYNLTVCLKLDILRSVLPSSINGSVFEHVNPLGGTYSPNVYKKLEATREYILKHI